MTRFVYWISSLGLAGTLFVGGASTAAAESDDSRPEEVSEWGRKIRLAVESGSLELLEISGVVVKDRPDRHVEVRQFHTSPTEIETILAPAATILENQAGREATTVPATRAALGWVKANSAENRSR